MTPLLSNSGAFFILDPKTLLLLLLRCIHLVFLVFIFRLFFVGINILSVVVLSISNLNITVHCSVVQSA